MTAGAPRAGLLCAAAVVLLSCQPVLQVELASEQEQLPAPAFVVTDPSRPGERPRYDTVQVLDRGGTLLWHLRAEPFGDTASVGQFAYGDTLAGFTAVQGPAALEPGGRYVLYVIGVMRGSLHFDVDAAGSAHKVAP